MGMFDNLIKLADKGLQAVESGALEKSLGGAVDKFEAGLDKAFDAAEKAAAKPEELLHRAEAKNAHVAKVAGKVGKQVDKVIDII